VRVVQVGPLAVLPGVAVELAVLAPTVGLGPGAVAAGAATAVVTCLLVETGMRREGLTRLGPANRVTLLRAALAAGIAALVVQSWQHDVPRPVVVALTMVALSLDLVDGRLARTRGEVTALGAAFDMETDAFLILVLSAYVVPVVGAWVLLIGIARYLLLAAGSCWPWLTESLPPRAWAKVVAAVQGVVLTVAAARVLPAGWSLLLVAVSLALLAESFGRQIVTLWRRRHLSTALRSPGVRLAVDVLALATVWVALMVPRRPDQVSPTALLGIPVELVVFLALGLVLPTRPGRLVAGVSGVLLTVAVVLTGLDLAFYEAFDRPFDAMSDPGYLGSGLDLLHSTLGRAGQVGVVVAIVVGVLAGASLLVWAALRTRRAVRRAPRAWTRVTAALALVWTVAGLGGAHVSGLPVAAAPAASLVHAQVVQVQGDLRDRASFQNAVANDPYAQTAGPDLLTRLRGKDVLVVFVESYGQVAVQGSWFSPPVDATLDRATGQLAGMGFQARSGWLQSPTFGGISWLAHSTFETGLWIDSQQRYDQVMGSDRFSLVQAFGRAGWRTVGDVPSDPGGWPQGKRFYHYDRLYGAFDVGYVGPRFSYADMPDQYTFKAFADRELAPRPRRPVMAEIDLVSSHTPWTPLPRMVPWRNLGDGSVFDGMQEAHSSLLSTFGNNRTMQHDYAQSIRYSLRSLVSFVQNAHDKKLVMVVLGDHQPNALVSGTGVSHDVPVSLIAHDPRVLRRISDWDWTPGLRPEPTTHVMRMDRFRDTFLSAFGSQPSSP
jgi:phosphatidylglycerophosphate synthase